MIRNTRSCTALVASPQSPISSSDGEADSDTARGAASDRITPPSAMEAAPLPSRTCCTSLWGDSTA